MSELIISVSGLRGVIGESLSPKEVVRFVAAYASGLQHGRVVVTRDGRSTGEMIASVVRSTLQASGMTVVDAGIAATPTTGILVRSLDAVGGVQISASHNPPEYNGLKLFDQAGRVIPAAAGEKVLQRYHENVTTWADYQSLGSVEVCTDPHEEHLKLVLGTVDVKKIRDCKFKVLIDSNHGAGSLLGLRLLKELGCEVVGLGTETDGQFAHPPEPTAANLTDVSQHVVAAKAAIAFCQDPDADRLAVIDESGRYIGEEYTLALCLDHVLSRQSGAIVTNCATSLMAKDLAAKYGGQFIRSAVGEANVVDSMLAHDAVFGGEGNGGPIDPRVGYVRDSFVGMALILDLMADRDLPVSALADALPRYEINKTTVALDRDQLPAAVDALASHFQDAKSDRSDGLRLDWDGKWLLVRGSNTELIVRLIAEAGSIEEAKALCLTASQVISEL